MVEFRAIGRFRVPTAAAEAPRYRSAGLAATLLACLVAFALSSVPAHALSVTLEDVVRIVLERSLDVEKARQGVHRSEALLRQARGKFDWNVFADTGVSRKEVPDEVGGLLSADTTTETIYGSSVGVRKTFRNGIAVSPRVSIFRGVDDDSTELFTQSRTGAGVAIEVPLLRGAGQANAAADLLARRTELRAAEASATFQTQRLLQVAVRIYWRCLALETSLAILLELGSDVGDFGETVRELVEKGELAPIAHQEATADLGLRRLEINRARALLRLARRDLAKALGQDIEDDPEQPTAKGELPPVIRLAPAETNRKALLGLALGARADLKSLKRIAESEDIRRSEAENALQPKLDIVLDQDSISLRFAKSLNGNLEKGTLGARSVAVHLAQLDLQLLHRDIRSQVGLAVDRLTQSSENYQLAVETYWLLRSVADDKRRQVAFGASQRREHIAALDKLARIHREAIDSSLKFAVALSELRLITGTITVDGSRTAAEIAKEFLTLPTLP